ncbi:MAG: hypothetical protein Q8910_02785 [Bacteroidota bacterium]|nr:hypothetical protein [Bacteroidota bacterium]
MLLTNTSAPVLLKKLISPKLNVNRHVVFGSVVGPQDIIYRVFQSQSFSNSQFNVNCVFNSSSMVDVSTAMLVVKFRTTFVGKSGGPGIPLIQMAGADTAPGVTNGTLNELAPRQYPLAQVLSNLQIQIENDTPSSSVQQYFPQCFARYYNNKESQDMYSCPAMLDATQNYQDLPIGAAVDPLNNWVNNSAQRTRGGGSIASLKILRNDSTGAPGDTAVVEFTTYEPFYVSPFIYSADRRQARQATPLIGLQTLIINATLGAQNSILGHDALSRIWSFNPRSASTLTSVSTSVDDVSANMSYYQRPLTYPLRDSYSYPYHEMLALPTLIRVPVAPNDITTIQMNTTKVSAVPSSLFIWAGRDPATQSISTTDTAFLIEAISITFNGRDGILSSATVDQLYGMSSINGLVDSFQSFTKNAGSFLRLKFGSDINLPANLSPGCAGNFDLSMTVRVRNINTLETITPQLNVIVQYEGVYSQNNGQWSRSIAPISQRDVLLLQQDGSEFKTYDAQEMLNGGSVFSRFANFLLSNTPYVSTGMNIARALCGPHSKKPICKFVRGEALIADGDGDGEGEGEGEGTFLGGVGPKKKAKGKSKAKAKSKSKAKAKAKSKSRGLKRCPKGYKRKCVKGSGMLSFHDLQNLM